MKDYPFLRSPVAPVTRGCRPAGQSPKREAPLGGIGGAGGPRGRVGTPPGPPRPYLVNRRGNTEAAPTWAERPRRCGVCTALRKNGLPWRRGIRIKSKIEPFLRLLPSPHMPPAPQQTFVTPRRKFELPERRGHDANPNRTAPPSHAKRHPVNRMPFFFTPVPVPAGTRPGSAPRTSEARWRGWLPPTPPGGCRSWRTARR